MAWEELMDPTNPFNRRGLSDEVESILDYLVDAKTATGIDVVVTSTTDHPKYSNAGNLSRHRQEGTDGEGLALDCRMRQRGYNQHRAVFELFRPVALSCHELIYANAPMNVKNERWVPPYATADHHDHVHVAVDRGVLLRYKTTVPPPSTPQFPPVYWRTAEGEQRMSQTVRVELDAEGRGNELTSFAADALVSLEVWAPVRPNVDGWYPGDPGRIDPRVYPFNDGDRLGVIVVGGPHSTPTTQAFADVVVTVRG